MKKKFTLLLSFIVMSLFFTGCYKYDMDMQINKDKSMNFSLIVGIDIEATDDFFDSMNSDSRDEEDSLMMIH